MSVPFRPRFNQRAEPISLAGFALVVIVGFLMLLVLLVGVID